MRSLFLVLLLVFAVACVAPAETTATDNSAEEGFDEADLEVSDWKSELMKFTGMLPQYHVEYDVEMTSPGYEYDGSMAMYMDGERFRVDSTFEGTESRTFMMGDEIIVCTNDGSWTCMSFNPASYTGETNYVEQTSNQAAENVDLFEDVATSTRTIVGEKTTCFTYSYEGQEHELCYAKSGAMLSMETQSADTYMKYVATSYSDRVSESDFKPPAQPQSMDDLMGDFDISAYQ